MKLRKIKESKINILVGITIKEAALGVLERQCKQKPTNCLQPQIYATHLTHTVSETQVLNTLPKLVVEVMKYWHDKKRVIRSRGRKE